ncbi:hypothetical protein P691DRAFT_656438 [Macrolepiota fuliginosa MF-IS2]|uniref:ATP-dependent DNA helicase n=1 Tax=Macrolepiota fuliginosa MF-IS2 TaxID=1400762 RepID=A0A9P6C6R0_9AGAR|nr:hypothetical protein P691DRAFT_656438 [Macrolepiota fuliginosa MF-IS2]
MSKSQSGLGRVKRDWSNASMGAASCSSDLIEWDPTPPRKQEQAPDVKMQAANKRLLAIKQALASMATDKPPSCAAAAPRSFAQSVPNNNGKRPSLDPVDTAPAPAKKPRQLPTSWRDDTLSNPSFTRTSSAVMFSNSSTSSKPKKMAKLFLSQEQTHILKLVEEGNSVFYTGSAGTGKSVLLREIIKTLRKKHLRTPDAVAVTASTGSSPCDSSSLV